jgi:hypothetical protein
VIPLKKNPVHGPQKERRKRRRRRGRRRRRRRRRIIIRNRAKTISLPNFAWET